MRHARQFREGIAARRIIVLDPVTGDPVAAGVTAAAVGRLLAAGWLRWKNPAVRNRVVTTRPAREDRDTAGGGTLW
jgi:hypothetical protein